jgi:hypothetical protein
MISHSLATAPVDPLPGLPIGRAFHRRYEEKVHRGGTEDG